MEYGKVDKIHDRFSHLIWFYFPIFQRPFVFCAIQYFVRDDASFQNTGGWAEPTEFLSVLKEYNPIGSKRMQRLCKHSSPLLFRTQQSQRNTFYCHTVPGLGLYCWPWNHSAGHTVGSVRLSMKSLVCMCLVCAWMHLTEDSKMTPPIRSQITSWWTLWLENSRTVPRCEQSLTEHLSQQWCKFGSTTAISCSWGACTAAAMRSLAVAL